MEVLDLEMPSYEELWARDKELLRGARPDLEIDWESEVPNNEDELEIVSTRSGLLERASDWSVNQGDIERILGELRGGVEEIFGQGLANDVEVEVVGAESIIERSHEIQTDAIMKIGWGERSKMPSGIEFYPHKGLILVPDRLPLLVPKGLYKGDAISNMRTMDADVRIVPWDEFNLEANLANELSNVMYRQLRGEWREGYIEAAKALGRRFTGNTGVSATYYVTDRLAKNHSDWGLHVVSMNFFSGWSDRRRVDSYRAFEGVAEDRGLKMACLYYSISVSDERVIVDYNTDHPNTAKTKRLFHFGSRN